MFRFKGPIEIINELRSFYGRLVWPTDLIIMSIVWGYVGKPQTIQVKVSIIHMWKEGWQYALLVRIKLLVLLREKEQRAEKEMLLQEWLFLITEMITSQ